MFKFTTQQIGVIPESKAQAQEPSLTEETRLLVKGNLSSNYQAVGALQLQDPGGCNLGFRTAVVKLVGMKLAGIGIATGLTAAAGLDQTSTRSCALSSAICLVASYFYYLIWHVRRQGWVGGPIELSMFPFRQRILTDDDVVRKATMPQRVFIQETAVDGLRQVDWTVTVRYATHTPI